MFNRNRSVEFVIAAALIAVVSTALAFRSSAGDSVEQRATQAEKSPQFDYHDDRDGRNLADVELKLERTGANAEPSLNIRISAVGPNVDPIPGYRGVRGANRFTAEELELMLSGKHAVRIQTWHQTRDATAIEGSLKGGRRGHIPERRLQADGRIDVLAVTRATYPLDVTIDSGTLKLGDQHTDIVVDGIPRLRISFDFDGREAHITGFESLGDPDHNDAEPLNAKQVLALAATLDVKGAEQAAKPAKPVEYPAPVTDADWDARDLEGKWYLYDKKSKEPDFNREPWTQYLIKRQDFEFLEWLGLYQLDLMKQDSIGWILANANAPQWMRAAAWSRRSPQSFGHGEAQARSILRTHNPRLAYSWLDKHKDSFTKVESETKRDYKFLRMQGFELQELGNALPPLKASEVLMHLDAPADLAEFGDRKKAEAGKVYEHQVVRAIEGMVNSGHYEEPWISKVIALTNHKNAKVRQAAFLSVTHFFVQMDATKYPLTSFEKVIDDPKESAAIREAAFTAYSYFSHPAVFAKLHSIGLDPAHPAWRMAISRLGDFSSEFTLTYLAKLSDKELAEPDAQIWQANAERIRTAVESRNKSRETKPSKLYISFELERAAWAEYTNDPITATFTQWTIRSLAGQLDESTVPNALAVRKSYEPKWATGDAKEKLQARVRELAGNVIEEWKTK